MILTIRTEGKVVSDQPVNDWVGVPYIAQLAGCAEGTVYRWLKAGKIPQPCCVRPMRWRRDDVDEWMGKEVQPVECGGMGTEEITEKRCTKCGEVKPISEFYRRAASKDGFQTYCKSCLAENRRKNMGNVRERERVKRAEERRELAWYRENFPQEGEPWNE